MTRTETVGTLDTIPTALCSLRPHFVMHIAQRYRPRPQTSFTGGSVIKTRIAIYYTKTYRAYITIAVSTKPLYRCMMCFISKT